MTSRELTAQQTDPLGALNQRPITLVLALFALVLAAVRTIRSMDEFVDYRMAVASVLFLVVATTILVVSTSPLRAPFRRVSYALILSCGILALVFEALSTAGRDRLIRDDWGSAALGLLLLACGPYRPGRDIAWGTLAGAVGVGIVVWFEIPGFVTPAPAAVFLVVGLTPVVAMGVGSAVYSSMFVRLVQQWLDRASRLTEVTAQEMRPGIAKSVQHDRVADLNRDVMPFFEELVERGTVTEEDRAQASSVATAIRERIVAETDRTWLEQLLLDICPRGRAGTVVDREHLASHMTSDQRTAIRAVVKALATDDATRSASLGIVLHDDKPLVRALIRIESASVDTAVRQRYAPYFAVLRILFRDLQVDVAGSFLTLRFSYDQH